MKPRKRKKKKAQNTLLGAALSQAQINLLLGHYQAKRFVEAEALAVSLTQRFPNHPFAWKVLGSLLKQTGRINESLAVKQKSVELSPHDAEAHSNLGVTLHELGNLNEAKASYRRAIVLNPEYAEAHNNLGNAFQEQGKFGAAEASFRQAVLLNPDYAKAHKNLGVTLREQGKLDEAEASYRQAIILSPRYAHAYGDLGVTLYELGKLAEAEKSYRQAIALQSDYFEAWGNLGITLQELGKLDEAEASYRQAILLRPDFAEAHRHLAMVKKLVSKDQHYWQMWDLYHDPDTAEDAKCHFAFALAKVSEDLEKFSESFQFYAAGNSLRKKQLGYNKVQEEKRFERLKATYSHLAAHSLELEMVVPEHNPIFIVGMPRSGTTLVEQIISSHPMVTGAGELNLVSQFGSPLAGGKASINGEVLKDFREKYTEGLRRYAEGKVSVTDKMPQNFTFLGLIAAAFPEAKIIHVEREPAAVCWANYTQDFNRASLRYCYSLDDILHYHELYKDLMEHWHRALPNRIYDLDYQALTTNLEDEAHKLIYHLELDWDDACLSPEKNKRAVRTASSVQVRHSVYQGSSDRWKRYQPYLNGALDHFGVGDK